MKHSGHILRLVIVLGAVGIGFFAARSFMVPESFGIQDGGYTYGYYRGASAKEQADLPELYQGPEKCKGCHEEQYIKWEQAEHKGVSCETCHGNWQAHNNNTKEKAGRDMKNEGCLQCHERLAARPDGFPQISDIESHVKEKGKTFEKGITCVSCHKGHDPKA
jgi:hypothetical protein